MKTSFKMPAAAPTDKEKREDAFIKAAPMQVNELMVSGEGYPWEGMRSDKPTEIFNLRLTEVEKSMLEYISKTTGVSQQKFAYSAFRVALKTKILELTSVK